MAGRAPTRAWSTSTLQAGMEMVNNMAMDMKQITALSDEELFKQLQVRCRNNCRVVSATNS